MPSYRKPGVYVDPTALALPEAETRMDVAGFVGIAARGDIGRPVRVDSWNAFVATFGEPAPQGHLGAAVAGFFANGGRACWVVRAADPGLAACAVAWLIGDARSVAGQPERARRLLRLTARSPGVWAHDIVATFAPKGNGLFDLSLELAGRERETWRNLSMPGRDDSADDTRVDRVINANSRLVVATALGPLNGQSPFPDGFWAPPWPLVDGSAGRGGGAVRKVRLQGGADGLVPEALLFVKGGKRRQNRALAAVRLLRSDAGSNGESMTVSVAYEGLPPPLFVLTIVAMRSGGEAQAERFCVSMDPSSPDWFPLRLNHPFDGSRLVRAEPPFTRWTSGRNPCQRPAEITGAPFTGGLSAAHLLGSDPFAPYEPENIDDTVGGVEALGWLPEVATLAVPDLMPVIHSRSGRQSRRSRRWGPAGDIAAGADEWLPFPSPFPAQTISAAQQRLLLHCRIRGDRFVILDAPDGTGPEIADYRSRSPVADIRAHRSRLVSSWGALYFPWLAIPDGDGGPPVARPPCGHIAGLYAATERRGGIAAAPAGQMLQGAADVTVRLRDAAAGELDVDGVNAIQVGRGGVVVSGARTLWRPSPSGDDADREKRYVSVRRLLISVERAVSSAGRWTVFESNDRRLWRDLERAVRGVLDGLWRRGMLDGDFAEEAYSVRCDEDANPPDQVAAGVVVCQVGLRPPSPAEFITVSIGRTENATRVME